MKKLKMISKSISILAVIMFNIAILCFLNDCGLTPNTSAVVTLVPCWILWNYVCKMEDYDIKG
jgi:uncharacterized protein with PQ loop repeat